MKKIYVIIVILIITSGVLAGILLFPLLGHKTVNLNSVYTTTSPTIDGYLNSTEWASAFNITFTLTHIGGGESRSGELYILNNNTHLFLAFRVLNEDYDGPPSGTNDQLRIWLDVNNNEELDSFEDMKILSTSATPYLDAYHTRPAGGLYIYSDSNYGGSQDGCAAWNHTNPAETGNLTFETAFPFSSTDIHDLNVSRGTTIGIDFEYRSPGAYMFIGEWPGDSLKANEWAKLMIA
ncbi:MAG: hypothetical protein ACTSQI_14660 [Candidatus Helarchaeota archaeon]